MNVLVAEDDLMIADMIEESLLNAGYGVCGIARNVPEAVRFAQLNRPDLAIIDMKLADGGLGTEIIEQLLDGPRIGVLYASGNTGLIGEAANGDAYIAKPYHHADLMRALTLVEQIVSDGFATPPFPRGFHLMQKKASGVRQIPSRAIFESLTSLPKMRHFAASKPPLQALVASRCVRTIY